MEGRQWQLQQMRNGFQDCGSLLPEFLGVLTDSAARKRLVSGNVVTTEKLLQALRFDEDYDAEETPEHFKRQPPVIRRVLGRLSDREAQQFVRMSTGWNILPAGRQIQVCYKDLLEVRPSRRVSTFF